MKYQCVVWQLSLIAVFVASSRAEGRGQRAGGYEFIIINSLTFFNFKLQFKHPDNRYGMYFGSVYIRWYRLVYQLHY